MKTPVKWIVLLLLPMVLAGNDEEIEAKKKQIADYEKFLVQPLQKELVQLREKLAGVEAELDLVMSDIKTVQDRQVKYEQALRGKESKLQAARGRLPELMLKIPVQLTKRHKYDPGPRTKWLDTKDWWRRKRNEWMHNGFGMLRARGLNKADRKQFMAAYKQAQAERDQLAASINQSLSEKGIPLQSRSGRAAKVKGLKNIEGLVWDLEQRRHELEIERASIKADIYAREHSLQGYLDALAKLKAELEALYAKKIAEREKAGKTAPARPEGCVDFLVDMQIPTPRGAFDIPVTFDVHGSYNPAHAVRYARVNLMDPAAASYKALFGKRPGEAADSTLQRFTRLGEALEALKSAGYSTDFKQGAIRHVPAVVLYRIDIPGHPARYWLSRPAGKWGVSLGGFSIRGLSPGKHEVRIRAVTQYGERVEAKRTMLARRKVKADIGTARSQLANMAGILEKGFSAPDANSRIYALNNGFRTLQRSVAAVAESPGCTDGDLHGVIDLEARVLADLIANNPFWDKGWGSPYRAMAYFHDLCVFTCTEQAYQKLSSVAAAARAFAAAQGGDTYASHADHLTKGMADISLAMGKHYRAVADLLKIRKSQAEPWPSTQQLDELFRLLR